MGTDTLLTGKAVVFFDTHCILCNRAVQVLWQNDCQQLYYAGLDGALARQVLPDNLRQQPETVVFYEDGRFYCKSRAFFRLLRFLRFPWPLLRLLAVFPRQPADWVYDRIARNRQAWFGRADTCFLPAPGQQSRFFA